MKIVAVFFVCCTLAYLRGADAWRRDTGLRVPG